MKNKHARNANMIAAAALVFLFLILSLPVDDFLTANTVRSAPRRNQFFSVCSLILGNGFPVTVSINPLSEISNPI